MRTKEPRWVPRVAVEVIHAEQLASHGGLQRLRDESALESALGKPRNKWGYDGETDLAALAAAYGFGIAKNHPFSDGNKRTALLMMIAFLGLNGFDFVGPEAEVVATIVALAAGDLSEPKLAVWIKSHMKRKRRLLLNG
ncbi:MAG: type II toxin-antitoxin system death-on-curing family toxin [Phycisphaerae bacterium]|nr:type II toxin-antitoxin system death-on-curing family toxin [Phycisphaerae bacterium]